MKELKQYIIEKYGTINVDVDRIISEIMLFMINNRCKYYDGYYMS